MKRVVICPDWTWYAPEKRDNEDGPDVSDQCVESAVGGEAAVGAGRGATGTAKSEPHAGYDGRDVVTLEFDNGFPGDRSARRINDRRLLVG